MGYYETQQTMRENIESLIKKVGKEGIEQQELVYQMLSKLPISEKGILKWLEQLHSTGRIKYFGEVITWNKTKS